MGVDGDAPVRTQPQSSVRVAGDCGIDDDAAVLVEVGREVGAAAAKAQPGRRAGAAENFPLLLDEEAVARVDIDEAAALVEDGNHANALIEQLQDLLARGTCASVYELSIDAAGHRLLEVVFDEQVAPNVAVGDAAHNLARATEREDDTHFVGIEASKGDLDGVVHPHRQATHVHDVYLLHRHS